MTRLKLLRRAAILSRCHLQRRPWRRSIYNRITASVYPKRTAIIKDRTIPNTAISRSVCYQTIRLWDTVFWNNTWNDNRGSARASRRLGRTAGAMRPLVPGYPPTMLCLHGRQCSLIVRSSYARPHASGTYLGLAGRAMWCQ